MSAADLPFGLALAPDGRVMVFSSSHGGRTQLWAHDLASAVAEPLEGTAGGLLPFWSPDGASLGFFAEGMLRAYSVAERRTSDIAPAPLPRGGDWNTEHALVFAPDDRGLHVRSADGRIERLTALEGGETSHRFPRWTADGRHVIFFVQAAERTRHGIWMLAVDRPAARRRLIGSDAAGLPLGSSLLYSSGGALVAQPLDFESLALSGPSTLLAPSVGSGQDHALFAASGADLLILGMSSSSLRRLQWFDRAGEQRGSLGEPMQAWDVRVSPQGRTVAVARVDPQLETLDIWAYEDERPLPRRISPNIDADEAPAWSRDGRRLAWISGRRVLTTRVADASRPDGSLHKFDHPARVTDWAAGDAWIVVTQNQPETRGDILLVPTAAPHEPQVYARTPFNETQGTVSPDGRWLAYSSDESGRPELYVDAFPAPRTRARLTVGGGEEPRWSRDGRAIYFRRGSEVHVVSVAPAGDALQAMASERLFDAGTPIRSFDVAPDGRLLLNLPAPDVTPRPFTVIVNISALLPVLQR